MAGIAVQAGSDIAQAIQNAVQPKLIENGWVAEENDTTLSEYVTMMIVNGRDIQAVVTELGGDLLGVGEDDPAVAEFATWLFQLAQSLLANASTSAPAPPATQHQAAGQAETKHLQNAEQSQPQSQPQSHPIPSTQDTPMDEPGVPSGPKAMRNGTAGPGRGRDRRMLGQINNHLNREAPDSLRRIKGAASGQHGRINAHTGRDSNRGSRGHSFANGLQRMANSGVGQPGPMNLAAQSGAMMNQLDPQQQMAFMQMMEMQANLMTQMLQSGPMPNMQAPQTPQSGKSLFDRVERNGAGRFRGRARHENGDVRNGDSSGMEVDTEAQKKEPFDMTCRFNTNCTNPSCPYAHQSPAAPPGQTVDLTDTCAFGAACENRKCAGRHPSPAQRTQHLKQEVDCKFFPNCTNPNCPFKHPDMPLCRNGADCNVEGCKFTHSKIMCRYTPCTKPFCPFKHGDGQRGVFKDKVWTKDGAPGLEEMDEDHAGEMVGKSDRFQGLKESEGQVEELIIPGQDTSSSSLGQEAVIT